MKIALFAMPDNASSFDNVMRIPNLGLCSIAAYVPDHDVSIYDLVMTPRGVEARVRKILTETKPRLVGLSAMSFQFDSALRIAKIVREVLPSARIVVGGYHATVMYEDILREHGDLIDYVVRSEGEETFRDLVSFLDCDGCGDPGAIAGLSWRNVHGIPQHNPARPIMDLATIAPPRRAARRDAGFTYFGRRFDCVETSRGCTYPCTFCSIRSMYGKTFRERPIPDVVAEVVALKKSGTEGIFFVDDNIVLNVGRFKKLCAALAEAGTGDMELIIQAAVPALARDPEIAALMIRAGIRLVFMGIESGSKTSLELFKKDRINRDSHIAIRNLKAEGIITVGGLIVGNPDDTADDVRATFAYAREVGLDHAIVLSLQPYPGTELRRQLDEAGLITNAGNFSRYNGFIVNVRTRHMATAELARLLGFESVKLYLSPHYLMNSRLTRRYRPFLLQFLKNGLDSLIGGWRNRMFETTSSF